MRIAIVVPCTASKRVPAGDLRISRIVGDEADGERRFRSWQRAVDAAEAVGPARDLYAGPRWQASMRIPEAVAEQHEADLFIASAGLGLILADKSVPSYSATFSRGSSDSVVAPGLSSGEQRGARWQWWAALTRKGPSLRSLAGDYERVVTVLSPDYLGAVTEDLREAVGVGGPNVLILGTGTSSSRDLERNFVRVGRHLRETTDERPKPVINGLDATLLQSTAALVLQKQPETWSDAPKVQRLLDDLADPNVETRESKERRDRQPSTDEEVRAFIRSRLAETDATAAQLLFAWRNDEQRRCEEGRFKRLFAEVAKGVLTHG